MRVAYGRNSGASRVTDGDLTPPQLPDTVTIRAGTELQLYGDLVRQSRFFEADTEVPLQAVLERVAIVHYPGSHPTVVRREQLLGLPEDPDGEYFKWSSGLPGSGDDRRLRESARRDQQLSKRGLRKHPQGVGR